MIGIEACLDAYFHFSIWLLAKKSAYLPTPAPPPAPPFVPAGWWGDGFR